LLIILLAAPASLIAETSLPPLLPQRPFAAGEVLRYRIRLGPLTVGTATLEIMGPRTVAGRSAFEVRALTRSRALISSLYPVRDRIVSWTDTEDYRCHRLIRRIREGSYREAGDWTVDHSRGEADDGRGMRVTLPPGSHDVFSALLRLRASHLATGDQVLVPVLLGGAASWLQIEVGAERDVEVPAGRYRCLVLRPALGGAEPFRHDGEVELDLATGEARWPVRVRMRVPVLGGLTVEREGVGESMDGESGEMESPILK
jgi:hypothetical protein